MASTCFSQTLFALSRLLIRVTQQHRLTAFTGFPLGIDRLPAHRIEEGYFVHLL